MTEEYAVTINDLEKTYPGVKALKGVNVNLKKGKITGLIGPNGSGKSTMLKSIVGLVKPEQGDIKVLGENINRTLKKEIAFLPEINHFYKWMTIKQVINFSKSQFSNFDENKAFEIVEFMDLKPELKINNLSKGMVGRVKLVLTMARKVPLVIMDEPLAGIDPKSRAQILESLIMEYNAEEQTIILSTHEVMEAEKVFDYVVFLEEGAIKLEGNADDLRQENNKSIQELARRVFA
jgi:ABC-2 type transport system ATP-binding protein